MSAQKIDFDQTPLIDSDEFYRLSAEEQNAIDDAICYTEEATAVDAGQKIISRFECIAWDDKKQDSCEGNIELARYNLPSEIRWKCTECGKHGVIINFENTPWDLSHLAKEEARQYLDDKYNFDMLPGFDLFGGDDDSFGSFEESMGDIKEWMDNLSDEEFEDFRQTMEEEAQKMGISLDDFDGGLLPEQRQQLLYSDWTEPRAPVYLRGDLPLEALKEVMFFQNARTFLQEIERQNGFGITKSSENLQRKHVEALVEKFKWPDGYIEGIKSVNKVLDEEDVWRLHSLRVLLDLAGMIRKHKGKYKLVKKRAHLLKEEQAGKLYQHLFSVFFKKMSISYLMNGDPIPYQQDSIPYILFRMQFMGDDWRPVGEIMDNVFLDDARYEFYATLNTYTTPAVQFNYNILKPLKYWGLVEVRGANQSKYNFQPEEARKTPLFDAFLQFNGMFKAKQ